MKCYQILRHIVSIAYVIRKFMGREGVCQKLGEVFDAWESTQNSSCNAIALSHEIVNLTAKTFKIKITFAKWLCIFNFEKGNFD